MECYVVGVFRDFSKASDNIDHETVLVNYNTMG